jgi:hypothetical protein
METASGGFLSKYLPSTEQSMKSGTLTTTLAVVSAATAVILGLFSIWSTRKQLDLAQVGQRTWLSISALQFIDSPYPIVNKPKEIPEGAPTFAVLLNVKNSGSTPARNVRVAYYMDFEGVLAERHPLYETKVYFAPVPPGVEAPLEFDGVYSIDGQFQSTQMVRDKGLPVRIYGVIYYDDTNSETHRTDFCVFSPKLNQTARCNVGNDML